MTNGSWTYEDALLKQFAASISNNKREFYAAAPVMEFDRPMDSVTLPCTAAWRLIQEYGTDVSVRVDIRSGGVKVGAQIHEQRGFSTGLKSLKNGIPVTDFEEAAAKIEYLCEDLKRTLLFNLAEQHKKLMDKLVNFTTESKGGQS